MKRTKVPRELVELFRKPDEIRRAFAFVRANQHLFATCDGQKAPLKTSDENAIIEISKIVPRFALPPQDQSTIGYGLMSNGADGSEEWVLMEVAPVLTATADNPNDEIDLSWTLPETYDTVHIERSLDGVSGWTVIDSVDGAETTYSDETATDGVEYFYRVRGEVSGEYFPYSNIDSAALVAPGLKVWGANYAGALGNGTTPNYVETPTTMTPPEQFVKVASGGPHSLAIGVSGKLYGTGYNQSGELGLGNTTDQETWIQIGTDTDWTGVWCAAEAGTDDTGWSVAQKSNGEIYTCGKNNVGQLALGDTTNRSTFVQVSGGPFSFVAVCAKSIHVIKPDGTLWSAGGNQWGQIGDASAPTNRSSLTQESTAATNWARVYGGGKGLTVFAIKTTGALFAWGRDSNKQAGLGLGGAVQSPTQVGSDTDWLDGESGEEFAAFRKTGKTLWVCGEGSYGALASGGTSDSTFFTQVGSYTDIEEIHCCQYNLIVRRTGGALWGSGQNGEYELGLGDDTQRNSLTQIMTGVDSFACGAWQSLALTN